MKWSMVCVDFVLIVLFGCKVSALPSPAVFCHKVSLFKILNLSYLIFYGGFNGEGISDSCFHSVEKIVPMVVYIHLDYPTSCKPLFQSGPLTTFFRLENKENQKFTIIYQYLILFNLGAKYHTEAYLAS